jgi:hypothetical protein
MPAAPRKPSLGEGGKATLAAMMKAQDAHGKRLNDHDTALGVHGSAIGKHDGRLDGHEAMLGEHADRIEALEKAAGVKDTEPDSDDSSA